MHGTLDECDGIGRLAGDEFGVILSCTTDKECTMRAVESIRAALGMPHDDSESPVTMTASIGIACFPEDADQAETLVELARSAMYAANRVGGDRSRYFADVSTRNES
jgi:diguanylate cyclase (GGDEF)-like protein